MQAARRALRREEDGSEPHRADARWVDPTLGEKANSLLGEAAERRRAWHGQREALCDRVAEVGRLRGEVAGLRDSGRGG